jgi:hypothetical protein
MSADALEDMFVAECRRQGCQPSADVMRQVAVDLAGGVLTDQGLIVMPGKGAISPKDLVRSLRNFMPTAFGSLTGDKPLGNMTIDMRREIAASRKQPLPDDWDQVRSRMIGLSARMMDERAAMRRKMKAAVQ